MQQVEESGLSGVYGRLRTVWKNGSDYGKRNRLCVQRIEEFSTTCSH